MPDQDMRKNSARIVDQMAQGLRHQVMANLAAAALPGLIARHDDSDIDINELAKDAVAIAKATARELMLQRIL